MSLESIVAKLLNKILSPRQFAMHTGDVSYQGSACKKCGSTERYVSTGGCILCTLSRHNPNRKAILKKYNSSPKRNAARKAWYAKTKHVEGTEYMIQCTVVDYVRSNHPELIFYSVPNEASRGSAHYKNSGLLPGVSDLFLAKVVGRYAGLYIELKSHCGVVSPQQQVFINGVRKEGYAAEVCHGSKAAIELIENYLRGFYETHS